MKSLGHQASLTTVYPWAILIIWSWSIWAISTQSSFVLIPLIIGLTIHYWYHTSSPKVQSIADTSSYLGIIGEYTSFVLAPSLLIIQSLPEWWLTSAACLIFMLAGAYKVAHIVATKQRWASGSISWLPISISASWVIVLSLVVSILGSRISIIILLVLSWLINSPIQLHWSKR
jgi:hypothetical protein